MNTQALPLDNSVVDLFAQSMKDKLAISAAKGRSGWQTCPPDDLRRMLREHLDKGDPVDVANFAMFLWWLGQSTALSEQAVEPVVYNKTEMNCFAQDLYDKKMQEGKHGHYETMFRVIHQCIERATPQPPAPAEPVGQSKLSPTCGMNIAQRILHVGGRNNAAGYVEFGSIQAVSALVRQVIRDLPKPRRIPDHELVTMYDERPSGDADMIAFAHKVMDAVLATPQPPAPAVERQPLRGEEIYRMARGLLPKYVGMPFVPEWVVPFARAIEEAHGIRAALAAHEARKGGAA